MTTVAVLGVAAMVATGCGADGRDIADVKACLKKLDLTVEQFDPAKEPGSSAAKNVSEGVTALSKRDDELTIALAALVKSESRVEQFQRENKSLRGQLSQEQQRDYMFDSGSDGRYVWSIAGSKKSTQYAKAKDCIEP